MRIKRSYIFAGAILGAVVGFFALSAVFGAKSKPAEAAPTKGPQMQAVQVSLVEPTQRPYDVTIRGRTEAPRTVQVRSETAGLVAETPATKGSWVHAGQVLCRLAVDARQASLDQAEAKLRSMDLTYQANQKLAAKGFRSETQVLAAKADLDQASAAVRSAQVAMKQIDIKAPFAGVFDTRDVEVGGYLAPGQSCGTVVELDPILVVGDVPEADASKLVVGAAGTAKLTTGGVLSGRVRFVSHQADAQTRTYHVELVAPNPGHEFRAGLSGEISIQSGPGLSPPGADLGSGARHQRPPGRALCHRRQPGRLRAGEDDRRNRRRRVGGGPRRPRPRHHRGPVLRVRRPDRPRGVALG